MSKPDSLLTKAQIDQMPEAANVHQFNDNALRMTRSLSDELGMTGIGVHLVRLPAGHESTQFHFHHVDEEFVYILSGCGVADIGEGSFEVAAGDFMGFTAGSEPHSLRNTSDEDLVYLMGGNRSEFDICDYPRINRRMFRVRGEKTYVDLPNLHDVNPRT